MSKSTETESRLVFVRAQGSGGGVGWEQAATANR